MRCTCCHIEGMKITMLDEYRTDIAIAVLGLTSKQTLNYWLRTNVIPVHRDSTGYRNVWTFRELVAFRVLRTLRNNSIPLQQIRKVLSRLNEWGHDLSDSYMIVEKGDVLLVETNSLVSMIRRPGQREISVIVDLATTTSDVLRIIEAHKTVKKPTKKTA